MRRVVLCFSLVLLLFCVSGCAYTDADRARDERTHWASMFAVFFAAIGAGLIVWREIDEARFRQEKRVLLLQGTVEEQTAPKSKKSPSKPNDNEDDDEEPPSPIEDDRPM